MCFAWYRINVTVPERIGNFDPTGSTVVFETSIDDYAEVWVDGELSRALGQMGGSVIGGWNAPNRLVVGRNVKPGQKIQLAVFGINGPLSPIRPRILSGCASRGSIFIAQLRARWPSRPPKSTWRLFA